MDIIALNNLIKEQGKEIVRLKLRVQELENLLLRTETLNSTLSNRENQPFDAGSFKTSVKAQSKLHPSRSIDGQYVYQNRCSPSHATAERLLFDVKESQHQHADMYPQLARSSSQASSSSAPAMFSQNLEPVDHDAEMKNIVNSLTPADIQGATLSVRGRMRQDRLIHSLTTNKLEQYLERAQDCVKVLKDLNKAGISAPSKQQSARSTSLEGNERQTFHPRNLPAGLFNLDSERKSSEAKEYPNLLQFQQTTSVDPVLKKISDESTVSSKSSKESTAKLIEQQQKSALAKKNVRSQSISSKDMDNFLQTVITNQKPLEKKETPHHDIWKEDSISVASSLADPNLRKHRIKRQAWPGEHTALQDACVWLVLKMCQLLGIDELKNLLPQIQLLSEISKEKTAFEKFIRQICELGSEATFQYKKLWPLTLEEGLNSTSYDIFGWPFNKEERDAYRLVMPGLHLSLVTPANFLKWYGVLIRDHGILLKLQSTNLNFSHTLITSCMKLAGASSVDEIGPKLKDLSKQIKDYRLFFEKLREIFLLSSHTSVKDVEAVLMRYFEATGISVKGTQKK